jgi:hypothetical protein
MKDILWPTIRDSNNQIITSDAGTFLHEGPSALVKFFSSANKQLAKLRGIQMGIYKKERAFIKTVPTRWGT